jgi:hypothetical protein
MVTKYMSRQQEKVLVAILAGLIILGGAAFAVQPVIAGAHVVRTAAVTPMLDYDCSSTRTVTGPRCPISFD